MGLLKTLPALAVLCLACILLTPELHASAAPGKVEFTDEQVSELISVDGKPTQIQPGEKALLYFWATWCTSCRQKLAHGDLDGLQRSGQSTVLAVNTDSDIERVRALLAKAPLQIKTVRDPQRVFVNALQVSALPAWAVLERNPNSKRWQLVNSSVGGDTDSMRKALGL